MRTTFLENVSTSEAINMNNTKSIVCQSNILTFTAVGFGSGTWTATINLYPSFERAYVGNEPIVFTLSNTTPMITNTIQTAIKDYVANVSSITGTVSVKLFGDY